MVAIAIGPVTIIWFLLVFARHYYFVVVLSLQRRAVGKNSFDLGNKDKLSDLFELLKLLLLHLGSRIDNNSTTTLRLIVTYLAFRLDRAAMAMVLVLVCYALCALGVSDLVSFRFPPSLSHVGFIAPLSL